MKKIDRQAIHAVMVGSRVSLTFKSQRRIWIGIRLDFGSGTASASKLMSPAAAKAFLGIRKGHKGRVEFGPSGIDSDYYFED